MGYSWEGDVTCHLLVLYFMVFKLHCNNFLAVILEGDAGSLSSVSQQGGGEQSFQALKRRIIQASGAAKILSSYTWLKWEERNYFLASSFLLNVCSLCTIWGVSEEGTQWTGTGLDPAQKKLNDRVKLLEKDWKNNLPSLSYLELKSIFTEAVKHRIKCKVVKGQLWSQEYHLAPEVLNKSCTPGTAPGTCDTAASWVREVELDNDCGCWIQIPGQKGSGKGRTWRTNAKQEAACLPLHKAAVDAERRSHVLPAVLQAGASIPKGGGNMS